ncbi:META domain-containing protein [Winogradskyella sp.]|uniref:META domain-containing protein n=1 Tax=Winogradskyella sp. TaxID=1883156 RepID=UPI001B07E012|nr:META domain-containing protein [Winogradskyella sp.]MBO6880060.1 META domain-containing protein [Winogradskyella sp.]
MNKVLLTLFIFLFSLYSFSQSDLIGEWYLESFTIDGATYNNVYQYVSTIQFTEDPNGVNNMEYNGSSTCNYYFGSYSATVDTINLYDLGMSAVDCSNLASGEFEDLYLSFLSNHYTYPSVFSYVVEGNGNDQTLTLTKSNGDTVAYSKTDPGAVLHRTWYLQSITENDITYNISSTDSPSFSFGFNVDLFFGSIPFSGTGDCNDFTGEYRMYFGNGDEIRISNFTPTTNICNPTSDFETAYFSVLGDESANTFSFEIINNGDNLTLTSASGTGGRSMSAVGDVLIFSKQSLSINDYNNSVNAVTLKENPVENQLKLKVNANILLKDITYKIFSIDGKLVKTSNIIREIIDVSGMQSGIYFISFLENNSMHTLKFIKK